ncbi:MAG: EMC3/TMCO1 family protein, partial [Candidatus Thorarchaeota archaeon]
MASIIEEILDFVPSLVRRFGPENPPESSIFIAIVALGLSLSLTLLSRYLIDTDKLARYTRETKAYNKMKMQALRTADKKLQLQVDRQSRRAKKMQSELMNMRMRPLMFYFIPLMIIFFSMSSHYSFNRGEVIATTDIELSADSSEPTNEDLQILSHANNSLTYYNRTLKIVGTFDSTLDGQIWYNITGDDLLTSAGAWQGTASYSDGSWWTIEAEPKTSVKETTLEVLVSLNSTSDNSSLAHQRLDITVGDSKTIGRLEITSHTDGGTFRQGEAIRVFGTARSRDRDPHNVRDSKGNWADNDDNDRNWIYWNMTFEPSDESSKTIRFRLFDFNRSQKPLAAVFPFGVPEKILWIRLG